MALSRRLYINNGETSFFIALSFEKEFNIYMRIFIAEDEPDILRTIEYNLRREGFEIESSPYGDIALEKITAAPPDLAILDIMLPGLDGLSICRALRNNRNTKSVPVIMLTARDSEVDKITGLENGADDYITKPFSVRELVARVNALLRRCRQTAPTSARIKRGDIELDCEAVKVTMGKKEIRLTAKEFFILRELLENPEKVISREKLLEKIWDTGEAAGLDSRTVDVHIMNLRKKLGKAGSKIVTVKNFGYSWRENA